MISALFSVDKRIWIFGLQDHEGIHELKDNSKYLFLEVSNRFRDTVRPIWLTWSKDLATKLTQRGYEAYYVLSCSALVFALRAGCFITHTLTGNTIKTVMGGGKALKLDLWHGIPLKTISFSETTDYVNSTSESLRELFALSRMVEPSRVIACGYPRNDILFKEINGYDIGLEEYLKSLLALKERAKILLYAPTFRDYLRARTFEEFFEKVDFEAEKLDDVLKAHNAYLLVKLHHELRSAKLSAQLERMSERVYVMNEPVDLNPILRHADVLITDYSSVFFDFLLLDRPIVFYIPDYKEYDQTRGFSFTYDSMTPGPKARSFEELVGTLNSVLAGEDTFGAQRKKVREYVFDHCDGNSSERVFTSVMSMLNLPLGEFAQSG